MLVYSTLIPLRGAWVPRVAAHRNAITLQVKASMLRTVKPMGGWVPWPASKAAFDGKVTVPGVFPTRKLIESEVSVKLEAKRALAVSLLYAVRREAKPLTMLEAVVLVRQDTAGLLAVEVDAEGVEEAVRVGVGRVPPRCGLARVTAERAARMRVVLNFILKQVNVQRMTVGE